MAYSSPKKMKKPGKRGRKGANGKQSPSKSGIGSPYGHKALSGAYGKPMMGAKQIMRKEGRKG